jgi:hypothetical protein
MNLEDRFSFSLKYFSLTFDSTPGSGVLSNSPVSFELIFEKSSPLPEGGL